ncbi:MAG TPA: hypothetical protein VI386_33220 [Candidatus Sulfotelmatobacter sp.]
MKRVVSVPVFLVTILLVHLHANINTKQDTGYQTATVVSVDKHVDASNYVGDSPSDAPLQAEAYSYDVGIRLNCNIYVGRYESATDYLPGVIAPNHSVSVRMNKHIIYLSLPDTDQEVKMGIISRHQVKEQACPANG